MNDEVRKNLVDIIQAAEEIETFVRGMNFKTYRVSLVTQRAVERNATEDVGARHAAPLLLTGLG